MAGDVRLIQLVRILDLPSTTDADGVREAVCRDPDRLAETFFQEAAASDDVLDIASARAYLEVRLAFLQDLVPTDAADLVRAGFEERLKAWEE